MTRDLIVTIKTEDDTATAEMESARSAIADDGSDGSRLRLVVSGADDINVESSPPLGIAAAAAESSGDGSDDSASTSGSFWPDLEVLDPDHPV